MAGTHAAYLEIENRFTTVTDSGSHLEFIQKCITLMTFFLHFVWQFFLPGIERLFQFR